MLQIPAAIRYGNDMLFPRQAIFSYGPKKLGMTLFEKQKWLFSNPVVLLNFKPATLFTETSLQAPSLSRVTCRRASVLPLIVNTLVSRRSTVFVCPLAPLTFSSNKKPSLDLPSLPQATVIQRSLQT